MDDKIKEVMGLVVEYGDVREIHNDGAPDELKAIESKLRELVPVWLPIESAPKDLCTEFDGWNGDRVTNVSWGWPDYHPKEKRCWIRSVYETGYGWVNEKVHGLTHWMPLPKEPS